MLRLVTFDDMLIAPKFSKLRSRSEVSLEGSLDPEGERATWSWKLPVVSANMDTVTGIAMARAMSAAGGVGVLHRFWSIEENVRAFDGANQDCWCSVGLGPQELLRATALWNAGARVFVLDVAHAAQAQVAEQYRDLKRATPGSFIIVGNFATGQSVSAFLNYLVHDLGSKDLALDGVKVGVGPGSACTTRIKTGCGIPQLSAIADVRNSYSGLVIADGGLRTPGDIAKALGAGANLVMLGGMLAGTDETPGDVCLGPGPTYLKKYRGSASKESYEAQGKGQSYITAEGEAFTVPCKGSVSKVLQDIEGGLRSAFTYVGAANLKEFHERVEFVQVTAVGVKENGAHGKA